MCQRIGRQMNKVNKTARQSDALRGHDRVRELMEARVAFDTAVRIALTELDLREAREAGADERDLARLTTSGAVARLADRCGLDRPNLTAMIARRRPITKEALGALEDRLGGSAEEWMRLRQYSPEAAVPV